VELRVQRASCAAADKKCSHRFVYDWNETGELARARRWDYAGLGVFDAPLYPALPGDTPTAELSYAYSGMSRTLKTSRDASGAERHTLEIFPTLRLNQAAWLAPENDYERTARTETAYLGSLARVVAWNGTSPRVSGDASGAPPHVLFTFGDHLGSLSAVVDKATSELVEASSYQAYGQPDSDYRPERWSKLRESYRFTGKEDDAEVGLTYFGARYYHAALGRWISPDPLTVHGFGGDPNPYAYVGGSPMRYVDPLGLCKDVPDADKPCQVSLDFSGLLEIVERIFGGGGSGSYGGGRGSSLSPTIAPPSQPPLRISIPIASWTRTLENFIVTWGTKPPTSLSGPNGVGSFAKRNVYALGGAMIYNVESAFSTAAPWWVPLALNFAGKDPHEFFQSLQPPAAETDKGTQQHLEYAHLAASIVGPWGAMSMMAKSGMLASVASRATTADAFAAHNAMRADLGLATGQGTLARLEVGAQEFWGINAHGQTVAPLRVNAISATHAEADAFAQAARAGVNGGRGRLVVDRALCPACGTYGAVRSMARQLGLEFLEVVTPGGTFTIAP
jgi:RHS repeat-associated protein